MKLNRTLQSIVSVIVAVGMFAIALIPGQSVSAAGALSITPITWNVVGLDSNNVNVGPNRFPVGARVCNTGDTAVTNVASAFVWDTTDPYIALRPGSLSEYTVINGHAVPSLAPGACTDFYYEVEITRNSSAYDHMARYHITATADTLGTVSTATPREIYVEHLISQSRNSTTDVKLNGVSIPAGGTMALQVGNTYSIQLVGSTATNGYEQIENFINFPNTIFKINSVISTYSADGGTDPNAATKLYADGCRWENDPNSPNYRSCLSVGKYGGNVTVTYSVTIIGGAGTNQTLTNLIYDFSGSSYHYNADYSVGGRIAAIIDPASVTIAKAFTPSTTIVGGTSTLTFTLHNPNGVALTGANFTDTFPTSPGAMVVATPATYSTSGCGTPTFAPVAGAAAISFLNGTIAANGNCTINVNVTAPAAGTYNNTSGHLFIGTVDTGHTASASLTVGTAPPPPACTPGLELARWTMETSQGTGVPPVYSFKGSNVASATASYTGTGTQAISTTEGNPLNSWSGTGWGTVVPTSATQPYFDLVIDTSNFTGVSISVQYYMNPGEWAAPGNNNMYVYSSADGGAFSTIVSLAATKGSWQTIPATAAATTGTTTTTFRINARGAKTLTDPLYIDNIIITGCGVAVPPTITKAFSPNPIAVNGTSTLTFTLTNENSAALTGVAFTDNLPAGLEVANPTGAGNTCGATFAPAVGATTLTVTGGTIPARVGATNGSCTVTVSIKATTAGPHNNVSGYISSTQSGQNTGPGGSASASLTAILPPVIAKQFALNPIIVGGSSTLTFAITNPNPNNALAGVAFTDLLPLNVSVPVAPTTPQCGGAVASALVGGRYQITLVGGTLAAGGSCTVTVNTITNVIGSYANLTGNVSATTAGNGNTASDTLTVTAVHPGVSVLKRVSTSPTGPWTTFVGVTAGDNVYYQFTVENTGDVALTSVNVTDPTLAVGVLPGCSWANMPLYDVQTCTFGPVVAASGSHANTATAHGTYSGTVYNSNPSTATYATTGLTIAKSVAESYFTMAGDVLHYSYLVTNSGSAPLAGPVTVSDDKSINEACPDVSTVGDLDAFLDPGESITCTATYTVTAGDVTAGFVTNIASASAGGVTSNTDSKTVGLNLPDLSVAKTNDAGGTGTLGTPFTWTLTVTNTGTLAATFADGQTIARDPLPVGATYGSPSAGNFTNITNSANINCSIDGSNVLTCTASGASVTVGAATGSFTVTVSATPTAAGLLANTATVDPNNNVTETNEGNNTSTNNVTVNKSSPTIATTANPSTGTVGTAAVTGDTATLTSGYIPTGSVTFTLYSDAACTVAVPGMSGSGAIAGGTASWSASWTPTALGTYYWIASYPGDSNNNGFTTSCGDANEQIVIGKASPTLSTTPNPASGTVGVTLNDTAILTGGYSPTGSVTFKLFPPTDPTCSGSASYTETDNSAPYATTTGFASTSAGTWSWAADYSGDANNNPASSVCMAEQVPVNQASPSITTTASPTTGTVGVAAVTGDSATLAGGYTPTGSVTFTLYSDAACTAAVPGMSGSGAIAGGTASWSANWTPAAAGTYYWIASYAGDLNNNGFITACGDPNEEIVIVLDLTPVAVNDTNTAVENGPAVNGDVSTNDTPGDPPTPVTSAVDDDGDIIALGAAFGTDAGGSLTLNSDGTYSYTPPAWDLVPSGGLIEVFTYTITDADGDTDTATLTITVTDNDRLPVAVNDTNTAVENGPAVNGDVSTNDTPGDPATPVTSAVDDDGDPLVIGAAFGTDAGGSLTLNLNGTYSYTPPVWDLVPPGGLIEVFTYTITDADGDTDTATLTITVTDNNRLPVAVNDTNTAVENGPAVNGDVSTNDTPGDPPTPVTSAVDDDGDPLVIGAAFGTDAGGSLTLNSDGTYSYTPPAWNLVPSGGLIEVFTYTITDADGDTDTATLTITVTDLVNNPDIAIGKTPANQTVVTGSNVTFTLTVTNPGDVPLTSIVITDPACDSLTGPLGDTNFNDILETTETWTYTCTVNNVTADFTNNVSVSGTPPVGPNVTDNDSADVTVDHPAINIAKTPATQTVVSGANVSFTLTVTNPGDVALSSIVITDPACDTLTGPSGDDGDAILQTTETWTYTCTVNNVTADFTNNVSVSGTPPVGPNVTDNDSADVIVIGPSGLTKTLVADSLLATVNPDATIGEILTYAVTVTVPAGATMPNATLTDILDHGLAFVNCESITPSAATVTTDISGAPSNDFSPVCNDPVNPVVSAYGSADPSDQGRQIVFNFGNVANSDPVNDRTIVIRYRVVVLNIVSVVDGVDLQNDAQWDWSGGSLAVAGPLVNVVEPGMSLSKASDATILLPGGTITYTLTVGYVGAGSPVYDAVLVDRVPAGLVYVPSSFVFAGGQPPVLHDSTAPTLRATWAIFQNTGGPTVLRYQVTLGSIPSGESVTNTANLTWTSLPGNVSAAQSPYNVNSVERDYDPGSSVNIYGTSSSAVIVIGGGVGGFIPVTGFAPGRATTLPVQPAADAYASLGDLWLEIPKLNVKISIIGIPVKGSTWDVTWLSNQAGYLQGTAFPTWNGNSVLTAHVYLADGTPGPFVALKSLAWGDEVIIHAFGQRYVYQVRDNQRVKPDDATVFRHEEKPWVTLVTCQGYDEAKGTYLYRTAIRAVLMRVEPESSSSSARNR